MTDRKSNFTEAAESTLSATLSAGSTTISVTDTSSFPAVPFYATIDPGDDSKRETVYVDSATTGTTFTLSAASMRGQGNTSDVAHDEGARIIHGPTASAMNDLHDRVDADQADFDAHVADFDAHDHDGTDSPTVATSNLTGHDKAAHDALNIDADTLDGIDSTEFAQLAGATFTGQVSGSEIGFDPVLTTDSVAGSADTSSWPAGLAFMVVSTTGGYPTATGLVMSMNRGGTSGRAAQWFFPRGASGVWTRTSSSSAATWNDWEEITTANDPGAWEVDNSAEGGTGTTALTTSNADYATVTLSIPSDWGSWKCEAYATFNHEQTTSSQNCWGFIRIDGTDQQEHGFTATNKQESSAVGGRRTGMTTTGSRSVSFRARAGSIADSPRVGDIYLYARAVRTS